MNIKALTDKIDSLLSSGRSVIIAIDGPCAGGKTTLSKMLGEKYDCNIFHADDYFLRPEQRTEERMSEIGGNLDRERFFEEIIAPLKEGKDFSYTPFSCSTQSLSAPVCVKYKALNIIEGSYSHHPYFGDVYDLRVFLDISPEEQKRRILLSRKEKADSFFTKWIPKENEYFEFFEIKKKADMVL